MSTNTLNLLTLGLDILTGMRPEACEEGIFLPPPSMTDIENEYPIQNDLNALGKSKLLIGTAYDGLPILYDFTKPQSGSVLTVGQHNEDYVPFLISLTQSLS